MQISDARKRKRHHRRFGVGPSPPPPSKSGIFRIKPTPRMGLKLGGRYEIVGLLDCGGTSEVYLARDALAPLPVIVKMLTEEAARDMQHRERFILGARSSMSLDHPAIGRVFSVEIPPNEPPYLIMEALRGESLAEYLAREKKMSQPMALALACEVASGLVAAHKAGIIHRDIKPGNLYLVGPPGAPHCVKIIDFGLSKDLRNVGYGPASLNLVLGTAQYMAPEQVLADPVDERTDIYAFGVVLFGMLTGTLPFGLRPGIDLFCQHLFSPAPLPSCFLEDVDPRLEQLILRCLRKHPENRYESMQQLLDDLVDIESHPLANAVEASAPVLKRIPDVYIPRSSKGSGVAEDLARHFESEATPLSIPQRRTDTENTVNESVFKVVKEPPSTK